MNQICFEFCTTKRKNKVPISRLETIFVFTSFLLLFSFSANSQLLWKISGNGLKQPSYLFGTHHLIPVQFLDSVQNIYTVFEKSNAVVSEVVLNDSDITAKVQKAALLPDSLTMENLLSPDDFEFVDREMMSTLQMSLMNLNKLRPSMIQNIYELQLYREFFRMNETTQSDTFFQQLAVKRKIPVKGLETIEQQIEILFPKKDINELKDEARDLVQSIRNKVELIQEYERMNNLYRKGDLDGLEKLNDEMNKKWNVSAEENANLIDKRNENWMKRLPDLLITHSCFIAVGALHLPGEYGLLHLLQKEGYKVSPVK